MSMTTVRVLVVSVVVAGLLGLGALEVVSERLPSPAVLGPVPAGEPDSPPAHVADLEFREEPSPSPTQMSAAVQMGRNTVLSVDPAARRFRSLTGTGHVRVSDVSKGTLVVTEVARGPRTASFTGTAMAAQVGNEIWLGSFFADRLAYRVIR